MGERIEFVLLLNFVIETKKQKDKKLVLFCVVALVVNLGYSCKSILEKGIPSLLVVQSFKL